MALAETCLMAKPTQPLQCFLACLPDRQLDDELSRRGLSRGVLIFAIPELGILFRCCAEGEPVALEFGALFALLRFVKDKLAKENFRQVQVLSSNPEFVFAFTGKTIHLQNGTERMRLLNEYRHRFQLAVGLVEKIKNKALIPAAEYPSMPDQRSISFHPDTDDKLKPAFKPFQRGVSL